MVRTNNRGGQANEGGSLHRAGIAAYLAVHGLFGKPVSEAGFKSEDPYPVEIHLETEDAVDDIKCLMSDGSSWFIQAKRTCGKDAALKSSVSQWSGQQLQTDDRLGLAAGVLKGEVKDLGDALDKRRRGSRLLKSERAAIKAVKASFPTGVPEASENSILQVAYVLVVQAERDRDAGSANMSRWMSGNLVPHDAGVKAFDFLRKHFQHQAAEAGRSGIDDWVEVLKAAGITVYPDAGGPPAAKRVAIAEAVAAYRKRLTSRADILNYSLFSEEVLPLQVSGLLDSIHVKYSGPFGDNEFDRELKRVARRSSRFILRGLPGAGKTVALEQLAACLAADPEAPVPVLVPLRRLPQDETDAPSNLTLRGLISSGLDVENQAAVVDGLLESISSGQAILLLDGLDETFKRRAIIADGLKRLASEVHEDCGIILTTRDAGLGAAERLGMPVATLSTPSNLEEILTQLLTRFAESDVHPDNQQRWLQSRTAWLSESMKHGHPLWKIPLTAALMTVAAMQSPVTNVPSARAVLLCSGLERSVAQWEALRSESQRWDPALRPKMLLGAFAVVANLFKDQGTVPVREAQAAVSAYLEKAWGLAPALAVDLREGCLNFWNERLGILLISGDSIEPRHRQLVEVGQAMWIKDQTPGTQITWLEQALNYPAMRESAALALELSTEVTTFFLQIACDAAHPAHARALEWMVEWLRDGFSMSTDVRRLMNALASAANEKVPRAAVSNIGLDDIRGLIAKGEDGRDERDGFGWYWLRQLATLHLGDVEQRVLRMQHIEATELEHEKKHLAKTLARVTDHIDASQGALPPELVSTIDAIINRPLPQPPLEPERRSRRAPKVFATLPAILTGYGELAWLVAPYVHSLPPGSADRLYALAKHTSFRQASEIRGNLRRLGFEDPEGKDRDQRTLYETFQADYFACWSSILTAISNEPPGIVADRSERWRTLQLCRLLDCAGVNGFSTQDLYGVVDDSPELLAGWVAAIGQAHGIDMSIASAESLLALDDLQNDPEDGDVINFIMTTPLAAPDEPNAARLSAADLRALVAALGSASSAVRHSAAGLLVDSEAEGVTEEVRSRISQMPAKSRPLAAQVLCARSSTPIDIVLELLKDDDPLLRVGAAEFANQFKDLVPELVPTTEAMQSHEDMTVRLSSGAPQQTAEQAQYWTCRDCGERNVTADLDCAHCPNGARPGKHR